MIVANMGCIATAVGQVGLHCPSLDSPFELSCVMDQLQDFELTGRAGAVLLLK